MILNEKTCEAFEDTFRTKYDKNNKTWCGPKAEPDSLFKPSNLQLIGELITDALNKNSTKVVLVSMFY